jgi:hypothetical protein
MPSATKDLRIPKRTVKVLLALDGHEPREAELFVAEQRPHDPRPEDVHGLLEEGGAFLPARDAGGAFLFARAAVAWLGLPLPDLEGELFDEQHEVRVELEGGAVLDGELLYSPPEGRGRVVDHLNAPGRFLRLFGPDRLYLVDKAHVLRVVEKET